MKLKEIVLGLGLVASTLNGQTLQEFVIKNGARTPGDDINDRYAYNIVYPIPGESVYNLLSGIEIAIKFKPIRVGQIGFNGMYAETHISLYRKSQEGVPGLDRVILKDLDSDGEFDSNLDSLYFEGQKSIEAMARLQDEKEVERFFREIYNVAKDFCGLNDKENKEKKKSGGRIPLSYLHSPIRLRPLL